MPNDADSLTESESESELAEAVRETDADVAGEVGDDADAMSRNGTHGSDDVAAAEDAVTDVLSDESDDSPFGDELRLPGEDGYDGEYAEDDELRLPGEDGYDGEYADEVVGGEVLFDGDPDDFELDFGGETMYPAARPQTGDVLVLDDPAARPGVPPGRRMSRMERRRRVRLQARRVRRIIRHIEPWSVLKISIFFYACLWVIFLVAGFMIWGVAESSGTIDKLESLILELFALDTFDFDAGQIFRGYALGGLALAIAGTTFNVLMCLLFNLISDLTGGLRITMIEEESARPIPPRRRRRRTPARR